MIDTPRRSREPEELTPGARFDQLTYNNMSEFDGLTQMNVKQDGKIFK